jgi:hypothetical protein
VSLGELTALIASLAGLLLAALAVPANRIRRPALVGTAGLVVVLLGIATVSLWRPAAAEPSGVPWTAAPVPAPSPSHPVEPVAPAVPDTNPTWAGTVRLTSPGIDLDALPDAGSDASGSGNDVLVLDQVGGPATLMVAYRSARWPEQAAPTRQQCVRQLATQPLSSYETMNLPAKGTALCLETSANHLAFVRVLSAVPPDRHAPIAIESAVNAEVAAWNSG